MAHFNPIPLEKDDATLPQKTHIETLNEAITQYNDAYIQGEHSSEQLMALIDRAEEYIQSLPREIRERTYPDDTPWDVITEKHPALLQVLALQQKSVSLVYLPLIDTEESGAEESASALSGKETDAKSRWRLLQSIVSPDEDSAYVCKLLEENYWDEIHYHGERAVAIWARTDLTKGRQLRSFSEVRTQAFEHDGFGEEFVTYLDDPSEYALDLHEGLFYQNGALLDSTLSHGSHIETGNVIFVASPEGYLLTSDPKEFLAARFHHSTFLQGQPIICAGTMKFREGQLIEITPASGHYKPNHQNMLHLLDLLKTGYGLDLKNITIKSLTGASRNAEKFYLTKGWCLPDDKGQLFYELSCSQAFKSKDDKAEQAIFRRYLDKACEFGHSISIKNRAYLIQQGDYGYEKNEALADSILLSLGKPKALKEIERQLSRRFTIKETHSQQAFFSSVKLPPAEVSGLKKLRAWLNDEETTGLNEQEKLALNKGVCDFEIHRHMEDTLSHFWSFDEATHFNKPEPDSEDALLGKQPSK